MKRTQRARRQVQAAPVATPAAAKRPGVSHMALTHAVPAEHVQAFVVPRPLKGVVPKGARPLAMDDANSFGAGAMYGELMQSLYSEGLSFAGYPALAQMTQRAEYRRPAEILAKHMTRKWIRLQSKGDEDKTDKISKLEDEFERLNVQGVFRKAIELDGFFGRSQIYIDTGANFEDRDELMSPLALSKNKIAKGSLKALTVIEPVWTYPNQYNSTNPLAADFYQPKSWFVLGSEIHASRLMTIIGRQVPDMLKPAYAFGGLSLSQMAKPYVDNWLRTRQSVSDLIHSFSVSGLKTNLGSILQGGQGNDVANRVALFNQHRDNRGMMIVDKDTEEFFNVSTPLSGLDHLQAQSQEHMCLTRGTLIETSRGQVPIEEVTIYDYVMTRDGYAPVVWSGITKYTSDLVEVETDCSTLRSTPEHPIWSETKRDFVSAQNVDRSHRLLRSPAWESTASLSHGEVACGASQKRGISAIQKREGCSTASFTKLTSDLFRRALTFITTTKTQATTGFQTCASSRVRNMLLSMSREASPLSPAIAIASGAWNAATPTRLHGLIERFIALAHANRQGTESMCSPILRAQSNGSSASGTTTRSAAQASVKSIRWIVCDEDEPVYDITVGPGHLPEFYANGVLVHNSAVTGIPLSILLGITPTGLNASSEGEIRTFYDWIAAQQEGHITPFVEYVLRVAQLSLFGEIDPDIGFAWEPLWSMNAAEAATVRKTDADTDVVLINAGVISPEESRKRVAADEDSPYAGLDINDLPEPPQQQEGDPNGPPANADEPHEPTEDPDAPAPNQTPTVGADAAWVGANHGRADMATLESLRALDAGNEDRIRPEPAAAASSDDQPEDQK